MMAGRLQWLNCKLGGVRALSSHACHWLISYFKLFLKEAAGSLHQLCGLVCGSQDQRSMSHGVPSCLSALLIVVICAVLAITPLYVNTYYVILSSVKQPWVWESRYTGVIIIVSFTSYSLVCSSTVLQSLGSPTRCPDCWAKARWEPYLPEVQGDKSLRWHCKAICTSSIGMNRNCSQTSQNIATEELGPFLACSVLLCLSCGLPRHQQTHRLSFNWHDIVFFPRLASPCCFITFVKDNSCATWHPVQELKAGCAAGACMLSGTLVVFSSELAYLTVCHAFRKRALRGWHFFPPPRGFPPFGLLSAHISLCYAMLWMEKIGETVRIGFQCLGDSAQLERAKLMYFQSWKPIWILVLNYVKWIVCLQCELENFWVGGWMYLGQWHISVHCIYCICVTIFIGGTQLKELEEHDKLNAF